jgi:hypothetical protein
MWPVIPPPDGSVPAVAPILASLHPPLNANRSTATGRLRDLDLLPVLGQDKEVLDDVEPDCATLRVSNRDGLVVGGVILVDADPAIQEIATIQVIDAVGTPDLPARLTLGHPLWFRHRRGSRVRPATLQPPGGDVPLDRAAIRGDVCVFPASLMGLALDQVVEVHGGAPRELHRLFRFEVRTDGDGRYRLPPLSRVAQLTVIVTPALGSPSDPVTFVPDYNRSENQLDIPL